MNKGKITQKVYDPSKVDWQNRLSNLGKTIEEEKQGSAYEGSEEGKKKAYI